MKIINSAFVIFLAFAAFFEEVNAGPAALAIPGLITLGGAVTCNLLGCYGYRKLRGFNNELASEECRQIDYNIDLIVDGHLVMALLPSTDATAAGCKSYLMHSNFIKETDIMEKELIEFDEPKAIFDTLSGTHDSLIPFGSYPLEEIIQSFTYSSVNAIGHDDDKYNIVWNNCGDFLATFLQNLGHRTSKAEMMAIASNLVLASPELVDKVRAEVKGTTVEHLSDLELMSMVVEMRMSSMEDGV